MHYEELGLNGKVVSGKYLPEKYFEVASAKPSIQALAVSPTSPPQIFIGTARGLFRSDDLGKTWLELKQGLFNQDVRVLTVSPNDPQTVYAGTAGGIFKSGDGGNTWPEWLDQTTGLADPVIQDLVLHPRDPEILYAATPSGLFSSEDGGLMWTLLFDGAGSEAARPVSLVRLSANRSDRIYLETPEGPFRSHDGGQTWDPVWGESLPPIQALLSLPTDPEFLYAGTSRGLFKSFNGGRNWIRDKHESIGSVQTLAADPQNLSRLYLGTENRVLFSADGGDRWTNLGPRENQLSNEMPLPPGLKITHLRRLASPREILVVGTSDGLFLSPDRGKTWSTPDLSHLKNQLPKEERKMDLVKLITEIHNGRFFGSYFYLLVDLATAGLVVLILSGMGVSVYRARVQKRAKVPAAKEKEEEEVETDRLINLQERADDLSSESLEIHDMIEHINNHLDKCKTVYRTREKKEIEEIGRHITTLDKKMHHLMKRIGEFEQSMQN